MSIPELIPQESSRFKAWSYDTQNSHLFVRFHPTKKNPDGSLYRYENVAPEQWFEAQEAPSKGSWLIGEIINRKDRHPFLPVDTRYGDGEVTTAPAAATSSAPPPSARVKTEPASIADMNLVPRPIREVQEVPQVTITKLPVILPPDVTEGDKPFSQVMRERAAAIVAAVPSEIVIDSEESFKANGAALVVIATERRAITDALEILARPLIDAKRNLDAFRNEVLGAYTESEKRIEAHLHAYRRKAEAEAKAEAERQRQENEKRAIAEETERRKQEANRVAEEAQKRKNEASQALQEAERHATTQTHVPEAQGSLLGDYEAPTALSIVEEAHQIIAEADQEIAEAAVAAALPVHRDDVYCPPVAQAKPDLKVTGLRKRAAKWMWEFDDAATLGHIDQTQPISRAHLKNPDSVPNEYWVLDNNAINKLVDALHDRVNIPGIKAYDKNA